MENLRDLQAQARNLERSGQHAAAIELYGRILNEPAGDRDGSIWSRAARLQLALGQEESAADSYATASERYEAGGLMNLALTCCQRSLRIDDARPELLLRFGRLAALQGYARDARHGFVEYADRAAAANEVASSAEALREYLSYFPDDVAVRRRVAELTGVEEIEPVSPPAQKLSDQSLPGLIPTAHEEPERGRVETPAASEQPERQEERGEEPPRGTVEPLEGFEPTRADDVLATPAPAAEAAPPQEGAWADIDEAPDEPEDGDEDVEAEPLPLLGTHPQEDEAVAHAGGDMRGARDPAATEPLSLEARRERIERLRSRGDPSLEDELAEAEHQFAEAGLAAEALEFAQDLARLHPEDTALQQRRLERALRAGDRQALIDAYLALARSLEADLDSQRGQEALRRVLELDPANEKARAALASATAAAAAPPRDYVDLGELILAGAPEEMTRFQVAIGDPSGDEESDFAEILDVFRKKISESLDPKDAASHYDLGLAFKGMGLLDDAIIHLQSGLRGGANPLATLEILGECFVLKGQISLAARVFERATRLEGVGDSDLVGVLYGLARCQEELGEMENARGTFERVVAVDLSFRDAAERLQRLQSA